MRAFIDTNLFVYATYPKFREHDTARQFLLSCRKGHDSWYLSWSVIYEYLRVVTSPALFSGETISLEGAVLNVSKFSSLANVEILLETSDHLQALQELKVQNPSLQGSILHDAHIVTLMREHDISTIYSNDTDFHRFKDIEVINPLQ